MYEVVNTRFSGPRDFFRTREEAEEMIARRTMHTRDEGEIAGVDYLRIEEVVRASKPCRYCGTEVQVDPVKHPDTDWCRNCHYAGRRDAEERSAQLDEIKEQLGAESVGPAHTGGGCFWMEFLFDGDDWLYIATDGEASLPQDDEGNPVRGEWGFIGRVPLHDDYDEETVIWQSEWAEDGMSMEETRTDQQLVDLIKADRAKREEQS